MRYIVIILVAILLFYSCENCNNDKLLLGNSISMSERDSLINLLNEKEATILEHEKFIKNLDFTPIFITNSPVNKSDTLKMDIHLATRSNLLNFRAIFGEFDTLNLNIIEGKQLSDTIQADKHGFLKGAILHEMMPKKTEGTHFINGVFEFEILNENKKVAVKQGYSVE